LVEPPNTASTPTVAFGWTDGAIVVLAVVALVGCVILLVRGAEPPNWLSGIVLLVVGHYTGATRRY
jgi:hypothetical protein